MENDDVSVLEERMKPGVWYTSIELCNVAFKCGNKFTPEQRSRITRKISRLRKRGYAERMVEGTHVTYRLKPIETNVGK